MHKKLSVVRANIHFLQQGIDLLSSITGDQYAMNNGKYFKSGVGKHFRHIIDHYVSLVNREDDKVNYDARERDTRLETDRSFAIGKMQLLINQLNHFLENPAALDDLVTVKSNEGAGEEDAAWSDSSVRRELQFLISHTVHHYALIAIILKTIGFNPSQEFGVAPSTLKYEKEHRPVKTSQQ